MRLSRSNGRKSNAWKRIAFARQQTRIGYLCNDQLVASYYISLISPLPAPAANLSKALEEQKKAAEEKAANLSKAVDEQVASLRNILEEQRQKIEHLEAQQLHQTETRRVLL